MATAFMTYTQTTPTNNKIWTWSGWFKRGHILTSGDKHIFQCYPIPGYTRVFFPSGTDTLTFDGADTGGSNSFNLVTNRLFTDPAAWYHLVIAVDVTQVAAASRTKIFINGVQETSFSTETYPTQDATYPMNLASTPFYIGKHSSAGDYFDGSMSHVQLVDGLQLDATTFGSVDATSGIWKIGTSCYATPGANGFCLKMEDRTNLDLDSSSNAHTFTTTGTITPTYDNPSNNFATLNYIIRQQFMQMTSITDGNTTMTTGSGAAWGSVDSTLAVDTSKWYFEAKCVSNVSGAIIGAANVLNAGFDGSVAYYLGQDSTDQGYQNNGNASNGGGAFGNTYTSGDIIGVAMDLTNSKIYFSKNGVWENSGDPSSGATGTGAMSLTAGTMYSPTASGYQSTVWSFNYGNGYFGTTAVSSANADDAGIGAIWNMMFQRATIVYAQKILRLTEDNYGRIYFISTIR